MGRGVRSVLCLLLLAGSPLAAGVRWCASGGAQECGCDARLCRHHPSHSSPAKLGCHSPAKPAPVQACCQCARNDERLLGAHPYLPARPLAVKYNAPLVIDCPARAFGLLSAFPETDYPPPRFPLA